MELMALPGVWMRITKLEPSKTSMETYTSSVYKCPHCDHPLRQSFDQVIGYTLYCAHGPCTSQAANDGACGSTLAEAHSTLWDNIDEEQQDLPNS